MDRAVLKRIRLSILLGLAVLAITVQDCFAVEHVYLRADTVTKTMPDGQDVIMWGFAIDSSFGAEDGNVTVPGPVITVPPGENALTIHLDNDLNVPVSVVIPGQITAMSPVWFPDDRGRKRVMSFTHETAPGNVDPCDYTWTDVQPGTYIYQTGTHQTVQVQMGLYGCMKKDLAGNEAYQDVNYDNEVILFYSEIDPALHEAVATETYGPGKAMTSTINYDPKYFLVNGEPYSYTAPPLALAAGDPCEITLLRFLNMGLQTHVPVINGLYMSVVAEDGRKYTYPKQQYSIVLPAAKTKDATITPSTEGVYPVYDRGLSLTNAAEAPGGMFNLLDVGFVTNQAPIIDSVTATPSTIWDRLTSQLHVVATDLDARPDVLTYSWTADQGTFNDANLRSPVYMPPLVNSTQDFNLTVDVSDGGDITSETILITVNDTNAPLLVEDFNDGDYAGWNVVDQGRKSAPSAWSAGTGTLVQTSNIRSGTKGTQELGRPGTYAWY
ncbi:MAG: hypothetical protein ACYSTJ_08330, partial [Planctomycetota bacterium]